MKNVLVCRRKKEGTDPVDQETIGDGEAKGRGAAHHLDDGLRHQTGKGVDAEHQRIFRVQHPVANERSFK